MHLKQINRIVSSRCRFFLLSLSLHIFLCVWISISNIDWNWCEHCDVFRNALKHCVLITKFYYVQNGLSHFFAAMNKSQFKEKIHFKGALKFILRWRVVVSAFLFDRSFGRALTSGRKKACLCLILCITNTSKYTKYWTISFEINLVIDAVDCHFPFCAAPCSI